LKKLDYYILKQIAVPFMMSMVIVSFIAVARRIREYYVDMPLEILSVADIVRLCAYFLPPLAAFIFPVAYLIGIVWAMGQMGQSCELTAMKASGVSVKRISAPVIVVGAILSLCSYGLQNYAQPWGVTQVYALIYEELPQRLTLDRLPTGEMNEYQGWRVYFRDKGEGGGTLIDIDLIKPESDGSMFIHADSARLNRGGEQYELALERGYTVLDNGIYSRFDTLALSIPKPVPEKAVTVSRYAMSISELWHLARDLREEFRATGEEYPKNRLIKVQREIAERFSAPFAALVIAMAAAPVSARTRRKGHTAGFLHGAIILVVYYVGVNLVETRSLDLTTVLLLGWLPNAVMLGAGIVLFYRSDSI
jgi:lipopolysaccharide export system permease protein